MFENKSPSNPKWYGNRRRFVHSIEIPRLYRKFPHACNRRICWRFEQIFLPDILCHTTTDKKYLRIKGNLIRKDFFPRDGEVSRQVSNYLRYRGSVKSDRNIMLVDDEPDVLYTYKCFLSSRGYNVVTFTNPREALIHFVQSDPAYYGLVILDIRMPHLNGLQLFHKFREIDDKIKIIFVSALDGAAELVSLLPDLKDENIMKKPVNQTTFLEKVEQILS